MEKLLIRPVLLIKTFLIEKMPHGKGKTGHFLYNIELCVKAENNRTNIILSYYLLEDIVPFS